MILPTIARESRRFIRSSPLLSLSCVAVLGLGIGLSALAMALLLAFSSMVYPGMRNVGYATVTEESAGGGSVRVAWDRLVYVRALLGQAAAISAYSEPINVRFQVKQQTKSVNLAAVSANFFSTMTPHLVAGRGFTSSEEMGLDGHVTVLSVSLIRELAQTPAEAIGQFVKLDGIPYQIIGVAPSGFHGIFGDADDAWVPPASLLGFVEQSPQGQSAAPDVWRKIALFYGVAESDRLSSKKLANHIGWQLRTRQDGQAPLHASEGLTIDPVREAKLRESLRLALFLLLTFTAVSTLNYSLLLLARTPLQASEIRVKRALGAVQMRLLAELSVGPSLIAGLSLASASLICIGSLLIISRVPGPYAKLVQASWHVAIPALAVQLLMAFIVTLGIAVLPALSSLRAEGAPRSAYAATFGRRTGLILQVPVTFQIALCAATWVLAGMVVSSLLSLARSPRGYVERDLVVVRIEQTADSISASGGTADPNHSSFPTTSAIKGVLEQLTALNGVESVSYAANAPLDDGPMGTVLARPTKHPDFIARTVNETWVSPGYFHTMGTPLLRGRDLSPISQAGGSGELVINELLAKELWPGEDPIGKTVELTHPAASGLPSFNQYETISGVVADTRYTNLTASPQPTLYVSCFGAGFFDTGPRLVIRGTESPGDLQVAASRAVSSLMPGLDVAEVYDIRARTRAALLPEKKRAYSVLGAAMMMALLSSLGLYGSLSYYVATRRRDIAVRICFGASPGNIRMLVLLRAWLCAGPALALSLPIWLILARFSSEDLLGHLSWSTGRAAWITLACITLSMCVSLLPASAAVGLSPAEVLKEQ